MSEPPAGAQYSPDGQYWWDEQGNEWKTVAGGAAPASSGDANSGGSGDAQVGQVSDDGNYRWDGSAWQPAHDEQASADASGVPDGHIIVPPDLLHEMQNFDAFYTTLATIAQVGDGETYLASNVGVPAPAQDGDTAIA